MHIHVTRRPSFDLGFLIADNIRSITLEAIVFGLVIDLQARAFIVGFGIPGWKAIAFTNIKQSK